MPHCSRDLELTGTASSFISLGQDAELGGVQSLFSGGKEGSNPSLCCVHRGRVVRRSGRIREEEKEKRRLPSPPGMKENLSFLR